MLADTGEYIAHDLLENEDRLREAARTVRSIPTGALGDVFRAFKKHTHNPDEPLDRTPFHHVVLTMLFGAQRGVDPGAVADTFTNWAVCPDREEINLQDWLDELVPSAGGANE